MTPGEKMRAAAWRRQFAALVALPERQWDLAQAALLIGAEELAERAPGVEENLASLDRMGVRLTELLTSNDDDTPVQIFNRYFFDELGFAGDTRDYYDPRNSMLQQVLARRSGIPITLSVVYMEIGRRANLRVEGIGLPGHFIVRVKTRADDRGTLVDPFGQQVMDVDDCQAKLDSLYGGQLPLTAEHLRAVTARQILLRMLTNLKAIYQRRNAYREALAAVERILLLAPDSVAERRDRGLLLAQLNRPAEAVHELRQFLRAAPDDAENSSVREQLRALHLKIASLN